MIKRELSKEEVDKQLSHSISTHVLEQGLASLVIAVLELYDVNDPRAERLTKVLGEACGTVLEAVNDIFDTLPDVRSWGEAEEMLHTELIGNDGSSEILH